MRPGGAPWRARARAAPCLPHRRATKFSNVHCLTLFFTETFGGGSAVLHYVGFKGVSTGARRGVVDAVYESKPQMSDHAARAGAGSGTLGL
jgi:hypothetical protein